MLRIRLYTDPVFDGAYIPITIIQNLSEVFNVYSSLQCPRLPCRDIAKARYLLLKPLVL